MAISMAVNLALAGNTPRSGSNTAPKEKTCSGIVRSVNPKEHTLSLKTFWSTRTFNAGDNCRISTDNESKASLADLHAGQKVTVQYENAQGVLIADRIAQHNLVLDGRITAVNPAARALRIKHGLFTHTLTLAPGCEVRLNGGKSGTLKDLRIGYEVAVVYEKGNGGWIARVIVRRNPTYVGTIRAIDSTTRTVQAKGLLSEKTFHLADGCKIVRNGKMSDSLANLRIGERVVFSYEDVHGVLVANRLGPAGPAAKTTETQAAMAGNTTD